MDKQESDETLLSLSSYWIQGRRGNEWMNIESHEDPLKAVRHIQLLIVDDKHDELRLVLARLDPETGETEYQTMAGFEGNQGEDRPLPAQVQAVLDRANAVPDDEEEDDLHKPLEPPPVQNNLADDSSSENLPFPDEDESFQEALSDLIRPTDEELALSARLDAEHRKAITGNAAARTEPGPVLRTPEPAASAVPLPQVRKNSGKMLLLSGISAAALAAGIALAAALPERALDMLIRANHQIQLWMPSPSLTALVRENRVPDVQMALAGGADPDQRDLDGTPVLKIATDEQAYRITELLLAAGADAHAQLPDGNSIMHSWAQAGDVAALEQALATGIRPDPDDPGARCLSPLSTAIAHGRLNSSLLLAKASASLDPLEGCNQGPLELAAAHPPILNRLTALQAEQAAAIEPAASAETHETRPFPATENGTVQLEAASGQSAPAVVTPETSQQPVPATAPIIRLPDNILSRTLKQLEQLPIEGPIRQPGAVSETRTAAATETLAAAAMHPVPPEETAPVITLAPETAPLPDIPIVETPATAPDSQAETTMELAAIRAPVRPEEPVSSRTEPLLDREKISSYLQNAIDGGDTGALRHLLSNWPERISKAAVKLTAADKWGSSPRPPVDYALLAGELPAARTLMQQGFRPTDQLLHLALDNADKGQLTDVLDFLLKANVNTRGQINGITPLMRAAVRADRKTVERLIQSGADLDAQSPAGETVMDFARKSGRRDIQEVLSLALHAETYRPVMFGLSWNDRMQDVPDTLQECKSLVQGYTSCRLKPVDWLPDATVIAQFDNKRGGMLSSLQVDSRLMASPDQAKSRFDQVARAIQARLPEGHRPETARNAMEGPDFFASLQPDSNLGSYYNLWSDDGLEQPITIRLKLSGFDAATGYYRMLIGNPFLQG